jgi:hypothetical protein
LVPITFTVISGATTSSKEYKVANEGAPIIINIKAGIKVHNSSNVKL